MHCEQRARCAERRAVVAPHAGAVTYFTASGVVEGRAADAESERGQHMERRHFTRMDESGQEQWMYILAETQAAQHNVPKEILRMLRSLDGVYAGFGVSQLHHALQTATMARKDNAPDEMVLAALCHDIGKAISIPNHAEIGASIVRKYVSNDTYQILLTHQDFQGRHYYEFFGQPGNLRERHKHEPWFAAAETFTDVWDQAAFDPAYKVLPLAEFEPLVEQFFGSFKM